MIREEIDAAIARHADTEMLVDQPYVDNKKVRVTGRFTVESLSPHRVLDERATAADGRRGRGSDDAEVARFEQTILDNLRKAGVQNTFKGEDIRFDRLDLFAGHLDPGRGRVHRRRRPAPPGRRVASGRSTAPSAPTRSRRRRRRRCAAPASTCSWSAASPSTRTRARRPRSSHRRRRLRRRRRGAPPGRLRVLLARMNPDLAMGDDLLKKTGAGNLFMVFGEPDVDIRPGRRRRRPSRSAASTSTTPPPARSARGSTDDIACWFIDTDYNGESFFVRHAYFTGGNDPYEQLRRALRADIDEDAWAQPLRDDEPPVRRARRPARSPSRSSTTTATRSCRSTRSRRSSHHQPRIRRGGSEKARVSTTSRGSLRERRHRAVGAG